MQRKHTQWLILPIVFIVIGLGWKYPMLGFIVPIVMLIGILGGFINGRYVCGNLCPRGAFYDRLITPISFRRKIPALFRNLIARWLIFTGLMCFMFYRILQNPTSWQHWGAVFWSICAITTGIGILLGIIIHPRTWCSFCPIGTWSNLVGGKKNQLQLNSATCIKCHKCEKVCPMQLQILCQQTNGKVINRDCLKCAECVHACSKKALHL